MSREPEMTFRPHHFMCAVGYVGMGYSPEFTKNFTKLTDRLRGPEGDSVVIEVTPVTDSICEPCPNRRGELCTTQEKIDRLDRAHTSVLGWRSGERVTWGEVQSHIRKNVGRKEFDQMCEGCGWKPSGVCEKALRAIGALMMGLVLAFTSVASEAAPTKTQVYADEAISLLRKSGVKPEQKKIATLILKVEGQVEKGNFSEARKAVTPVVSDSLFSDMGLFLRGQAHFLEARKFGKKNPKASIPAYERALEDLGRVREVRPETSLGKDTSLLMSEAEFGWAEALAAQKRMPEARQILFRGFQRLSTAASLTLAPMTAVETFVAVCGEEPAPPKKKGKGASKKGEKPVEVKITLATDPFCSAWLQKLASGLPKGSGEQKRISTVFASALAADLPSRGYERKTISYSAPVPDETDYREALDLVLAGENGEAAEKLIEFLKEYPRSTLAVGARYWLAQVEKRRGHEEEARKHLVAVVASSPLSYYGILASLETGTKTESFMDADVPNVVTDEVYLGPKERLHFERAKALIAAGERKFAGLELKQITPKSNYASEFLIYLASLHHEVENYLSVFQVIDELLQRSDPTIVSSYGLRLIFPTPHRDRIQKAAKDSGVDPLLVLSLMKQESAFEAKIASGSGAQGLMQLMPATAVETDPEIQLAKVVDPDENVRVGTKYLAQMIKRFDGNVAMALAAYNAGPHRVNKWMKGLKAEWGYREFIESIPFKETRGYVASIMRNYFWYSYQLNGKRLENLDLFWGKGLAAKTANGQ